MLHLISPPPPCTHLPAGAHTCTHSCSYEASGVRICAKQDPVSGAGLHPSLGCGALGHIVPGCHNLSVKQQAKHYLKSKHKQHQRTWCHTPNISLYDTHTQGFQCIHDTHMSTISISSFSLSHNYTGARK